MEPRLSSMPSSSSSVSSARNGVRRSLIKTSGRKISSYTGRKDTSSRPGSHSHNNTRAGKRNIETLRISGSGHSSSDVGNKQLPKGRVRRHSDSNTRRKTTGSVENNVVDTNEGSSRVCGSPERSHTDQEADGAQDGKERGIPLRKSRRRLSPSLPIPHVTEASSIPNRNSGYTRNAAHSLRFRESQHREEGTFSAHARAEAPAVTTKETLQPAPSICTICLETILPTDTTVDLGCTNFAISNSNVSQFQDNTSVSPSAHSSLSLSWGGYNASSSWPASAKARTTGQHHRVTAASLDSRVDRAVSVEPHVGEVTMPHGNEEPTGAAKEKAPVVAATSKKASVLKESLSDRPRAEKAEREHEKHIFHAVCFRQYIIFSLQNVYATPIVKNPVSTCHNSRETHITAAELKEETEKKDGKIGYAGASIVQCPLPHCRREVSESIIRNLLVYSTTAILDPCSRGNDLTPLTSNTDERSDNNSKNRKTSISGDDSSNTINSSSIDTSVPQRRCSTSSSGSRHRGRERHDNGFTATAKAHPQSSLSREDSRHSFITVASSSLSRLSSTLSACLQRKPIFLSQQQSSLGAEIAPSANTPVAATTPAMAITAATERKTTAAIAIESVSTAAPFSMEMKSREKQKDTALTTGRRTTVVSFCRNSQPSAAAVAIAAAGQRFTRRNSSSSLTGGRGSTTDTSQVPIEEEEEEAAAGFFSSENVKQQEQHRREEPTLSSSPSTISSLRSTTAVSSRTQSPSAAAAATVNSTSSRGERVTGAPTRSIKESKSSSSKRKPGRNQKHVSSITKRKGEESRGRRRLSEGDQHLPVKGRISGTRDSIEIINLLSDGEKEEEEAHHEEEEGEGRTSFLSVEDMSVEHVFEEKGQNSAKDVLLTRKIRYNDSNTCVDDMNTPINNSNEEKENVYTSDGAALYNIYLSRSFEAYADVAGDLVRCTTPGCGYAFWWPADDEWAPGDVEGEVCPKCRSRCLICGLQDHAGQSCEAAAELTLDNSLGEEEKKKKKTKKKGTRSLSFWRRVRSLDLAFDHYKKTHGLRECLQCGAVLHLESGCAKMRCRCGYKFCFVCGTPNATCRCRAVQGHDFLSLKEVCHGWSNTNSSSNSSSNNNSSSNSSSSSSRIRSSNRSSNSSSNSSSRNRSSNSSSSSSSNSSSSNSSSRKLAETGSTRGGRNDQQQQQRKRTRCRIGEEEEEKVGRYEKTGVAASCVPGVQEDQHLPHTSQQRQSRRGDVAAIQADDPVGVVATSSSSSYINKMAEPYSLTTRRVRSAAAAADDHNDRKNIPSVDLNVSSLQQHDAGLLLNNPDKQQIHSFGRNNSNGAHRKRKHQRVEKSREQDTGKNSHTNSSSKEEKDVCLSSESTYIHTNIFKEEERRNRDEKKSRRISGRGMETPRSSNISSNSNSNNSRTTMKNSSIISIKNSISSNNSTSKMKGIPTSKRR